MISNMAENTPIAPSYESSKPSYDNTIYYEISPKLVWLVRIVNVLVILMIMVSVIMCVIQAKKDNSYYLLICNLVISVIVCSVVNWWYRQGDLGSEKFWFVLLIGFIIVFQCISFDIFIFKVESPAPTPTPPTTTPYVPHNSTKIYPWTSMITPTNKN